MTRDYENARLHRSPKRTQNEPNSNPIRTRSEAQIPTGKLLGIFKPGTNTNPAMQCLLCNISIYFCNPVLIHLDNCSVISHKAVNFRFNICCLGIDSGREPFIFQRLEVLQ